MRYRYTAVLVLGIGAIVVGANVDTPNCPCGRSFRPVCGSDGRTYDNRCLLDCHRTHQGGGLRLDYNGTCCPSATLCANYNDPVCDDLGRTHDNECHFNHRQCLASKRDGGVVALRIARRGRCTPSAGNPTTVIPMTTVETTTQSATTTTIITSTTVETTTVEDIDDRHEKSVVVARKPIVRINLTEDLERRAALSRRVETPPAEGARCNFFCDEAAEPLCDSNGHTHKNLCKFELAICRLASRGLPKPHVTVLAACGEENERPPPPRQYTIRPTLTSTVTAQSPENVKYKGRSSAATVVSSTESTTHPTTTTEDTPEVKAPVAAADRCEPSDCEAQGLDPLCDSDGVTHRNECHFRVAICRRSQADNLDNSTNIPSLVHYGRCQNNATVVDIISSTDEPTVTDSIPAILADRCDGLCDDDRTPSAVCDNANQTHASVCALAKWNCRQGILGPNDIGRETKNHEHERVLVHVGACHAASPIFKLEAEICPYKCGKQYRPVCDTRNMAYHNLCAFQLLNCYARKKGVRDRGWLSSLNECKVNTTESDSKTTADEFIPQGDSLMPALAAVLTMGDERMELETLNVTLEAIDEPTAPFDTCPEVRRHCEELAPTAVERRRRPAKWRRRRRKRVICDSAHVLHRNECEFARARCLAAQRGETLRIVADSECAGDTAPLIAVTVESVGADFRQNTTSTSPRQQQCAELMAINCSASAAGASFDPYCGSDFVTYTNFCVLQKARCRNEELEVLFKGECERCLHSPCPVVNPDNSTVDDSLFVCDQDGETKSRCEFEMLRCIFDAKFGYNVTVAYDGRCCANADECLAQLFYGDLSGGEADGAVCDSLGRRHSNRCLFDVARCRARKIAKVQVEERACDGAGATTPPPAPFSFAEAATLNAIEATIFPILGHKLSTAHRLDDDESTSTTTVTHRIAA